MKRLLATLILITPAFLTIGQANYGDSREELLSTMQKSKKGRAHIVSANIKTIQNFAYKRNAKVGILEYEYRYDNRGNCIEWFIYRKNGKVKVHELNTFDDSNRITMSQYYNGSDKMKSAESRVYDRSGNILEHDFYKRDSKVAKSKTISTYDTKNNITESKMYDKKGKLESRIEYSYYDDGSKKQTIEYSGKGKVKQVWNFDCNPVGTAQAHKFKDTSKVCIHFETDKDGNQIKVKEEYSNSRGLFSFTMRTVSRYDKDNNEIDRASYKLNGKQLSHWSTVYNSDGRMTEYADYKPGTDKPYWKITYTYNSDGYVTESDMYWKSFQEPDAKYKWVYSAPISTPAK
ncbi:MAG TPA: hypothetical protein VK806_13930 [Bacteroidia bacterium]|nr:hypothetical protein [Bacteroidia bacterium]